MKIQTLFVLLMVGATFAMFCPQASSQIVPYKAFGQGFYEPSDGDYGGSGNATHLGKHLFTGNVMVSEEPVDPENPLLFSFEITAEDPQVTVAADGSELCFSGNGLVQLIPLNETFTEFGAIWFGEFHVEGGTGRFAHAGPGPEPLSVTAINDPFTFLDPVWTFDWTLKGKISLK